MPKHINVITEKFEVGAEGKYLGLVEYFTALIRSDALKVGDRLPTYVELQRQFGLTANTINRAMIELEQQGLIERRRGSGVYVAEPVLNTQPATRRRHGIIGLCGWGFLYGGGSSYWTRLIEGVQNQAEKEDSQVLLADRLLGKGWEKVDGLLISRGADDVILNYLPPQMPHVWLFYQYPHGPSVVADERGGMRAAVEHLLQLGHRRIAYLHDQNPLALSTRLKGYEEALRAFGIIPRKKWKRVLTGHNDYGVQFTASGRRDTAAWLADKSADGWKRAGCTALLCHNDETAIGALQAFADAGLKVPDDVSVVGFDGLDVGEYSSPQLTSVEMPLQRMGEVAIELLQKQIAADEVLVEHKVLPTELRVRESTAAPSRAS